MKQEARIALYRLGRTILAPITWILVLFDKIMNYTGPFAIVLKGLPVAAVALLIFSPYFVYIWLLTLSQSMASPWDYILYALWWAYIGSLIIGASIVGYAIETKGFSGLFLGIRHLLGDRAHRRYEKPRKEPEENLKEYLELLKRQENKR